MHQLDVLSDGQLEVVDATVVVPDRLLTLIAGHVERHLVDGGPERWLLGTPTGTPPHQNTVGHRWREALPAAGLTALRLHGLRHFSAPGSSPPAATWSPRDELSGHASPTTTLNTYGHLWPDADDRTRAATEGLMSAVLDSSADSVRTGRR